ncbi:glycoside hydrolase family protein [Niallia sp. 03190]|uniref:glycoside hydrolase family protein n=1 Tax=Niallia sp. 03190 TaxID=3458061 RepID=UPI0040443243
MKTSKTGIDLIKKFEGCRLLAYKDAVGVWTIGYGHTRNVKPGQVITQAQAEEMLKDDLKKYEEGVLSAIKVRLNQNQFDALVSFCYNLGVGSLQKSDLLKAINKKDFIGAGRKFARWINAGGNVLTGLIKRRAAEATLFVTPVPEKVEKPKTEVKAETTKVGTYNVAKKIPAYVNAADAKAKKHKQGTVAKGIYYVFNKADGMINVTNKKGVPGSWINPSENKQTPAKSSTVVHYKVKNGETVGGIANKYKTTVAAIKKLNPSIKDLDKIYPNQKIRIK